MSIDIPNNKKIAEDWIKLQRLSKEDFEKSPLLPAWEELDKLIHERPEEAWKIINLMYKLDSSDHILASIAAGPVEDLLCLHGPAFIRRIENLAEEDEIFKKMLGAVWGPEGISEDVWKRLKAVAGESF